MQTSKVEDVNSSSTSHSPINEIHIEATDLKVQVYKKRWYILFVFSLFTCSQAAVWNTWGPISDSSKKAFGWDNTMLALLPNWGPISYIISAVFLSWIADTKGLRFVCLLGCTLMTAGAIFRCFTSSIPYVTWLVNIAQFFNGLAGPVAMGTSPMISAVWFPPHERTTATGISATLNYAGLAVSFVVGPAFMTSEIYSISNTTSNCTSSVSPDVEVNVTNIRHDIMMLMYTECGWCVFIWLLMLIHFPSKPELPPSFTASTERLGFKEGFKRLFKNRTFCLILIAYGVSQGVFATWQGVISIDLLPHDISEDESSWIGFYSVIAGNIAALLVSRFADIFSKHMRKILLLSYICSVSMFLWLCLMIQSVLPISLAQIYVSIIIGTLFMNGVIPIFYEMGCEATYPVSEGITNFILTLSLNVIGSVFLGMQSLMNSNTDWMNWCLLATTTLPIPVFIFMKDVYKRLNVDEVLDSQQQTEFKPDHVPTSHDNKDKQIDMFTTL